tara:strand:- start:4036 stop:5415 length:1380 start_codon:yes stop_codon:yes gene_type:complete
MKIQLFNSLTRKKQDFKPIKKSEVSIYTCGPTVYDYPHIGNLRTYIFEDILKKTFEFNKYNVKHVMNITDVGHLTSDADTGEDKMEKGAKREGKTAQEIAEFYTESFREAIKKLNIKPASKLCKATDHIKDQIKWIEKIEKEGYTYQTSDGIYFDTSEFKDYGKLRQIEKQKLEAGKRVKMGEKRNPTDFALWKFSPEKEKRQMEWESPWGKGFPGWHIECSAMATKYLGENFDIHCGGIDHLSIHHPNEIAQTECVTKKQWVNYWMHGEFLVFEGKMSKSKGNFITLSNLEEKGYSPLEFRYLCLNTHYRKQLAFTYEALDSAKTALEKINGRIIEINEATGDKKDKKEEEKLLKKFNESINNDLNSPEALANLWNVLKNRKLSKSQKLKLIEKFDKILGLDLLKLEKIPKEITDLAEKRLEARRTKDWTISDKLRAEIVSKGFLIEDKEDSYTLKKA